MPHAELATISAQLLGYLGVFVFVISMLVVDAFCYCTRYYEIIMIARF